MLNNFPYVMIFLQVFIRISIQFGAFAEQYNEIHKKFPAKFSKFL